jgi:sulfite exporter TauE/SafE
MKVLGIVAAVCLLLAGLYVTQGSRVPAGQAALVDVNRETLDALRAEFNRTSAALRVIVLLSPT